ncbi:MAG: tetrahydromethanopterin S-methyltransferase subunit A [Candidatus Nealsonbacteria bacterium]
MEIKNENWPVVEGRYKKGNLDSPVAVCTNATVEGIELDMQKVALIGKCVTENIGIEKIIQNVVANPRIRFLILCGRVSNGHFVEQAFVALKRNGVDNERRIIGAKGNTPFLKGIDQALIERFRQQVEMVDLSPEKDNQKIMQAVDECLKRDPGAFTGEALNIAPVEVIEAKESSEFVADPNGFFVISMAGKIILVEHFKDDKLNKKIIGSSASDIIKTIAKLGLIGQFEQGQEHAMYLGKELQKAEIALQNGLDYEQDAPLVIKKPDVKEDKKNSSDDEWYD